MGRRKDTPEPPAAANMRPLVGMLFLAVGTALFFAMQWYASANRLARLEAQAKTNTPEPPAESRRVVAGISSELAEWLNASDSTLAKADVVELNLLVARELSECKDIDIADCTRQLDRWADEVRALLAQDPQGFEKDREKWKTRRRLELAVMGSVLKDDHSVRYVDKIDHANPEHKFSTGIFRNGTGTCASLPVIWTALGRRLGHPITLALAPEHLYCICDDGTEKINIEATGSSHLGIRDEAAITKECPAELVKNGTFMRPLSNREIVGVFLDFRAQVWAARKDFEKALSDSQRAHELVPYNSNIANGVAHCAQMVASTHPAIRLGGQSILQVDNDPRELAYRQYVRAMRARNGNYSPAMPGGRPQQWLPDMGVPPLGGPRPQVPDPSAYGPQVAHPQPGGGRP
mgnify:CR=1 FL=1